MPPTGPAPLVEQAAPPTKFIESLGALPVHGDDTRYYVAAVIDRAAGLAVAVAASAGLLDDEADAPGVGGGASR